MLLIHYSINGLLNFKLFWRCEKITFCHRRLIQQIFSFRKAFKMYHSLNVVRNGYLHK